MTHCIATTNKNTPCRAYHMKGTGYCFTHNPKMRGAQNDAVRRGGSVRKIDRINRLKKIHAAKRRAAYKLLKKCETEIVCLGQAHDQ